RLPTFPMSSRDSVVLPAPDGDDSTNISPRRATLSVLWPPAAITSLQILDLLAELLDDVFHFEPGIGQLDVVRLGAAGIDLAVELLRQEIEPPAHRPALAEHLARLHDVRGDAIKLLADIRLGGDQQRFLGQAVLIEAIGRLQERCDLFGEPHTDCLGLAPRCRLGAFCEFLDLVHAGTENLPKRGTLAAA